MPHAEPLEEIARCLARTQFFPPNRQELDRIMTAANPLLHPKRANGMRPRKDQTSIL